MDNPLITCSLCLMGDPVERVSYLGGAKMHCYPDDPENYFVVCADSDIVPVNLPVAIKVASA